MKKSNSISGTLVTLLILFVLLFGLIALARDYQSRDICQQDIGKPLSEAVVNYVGDVVK